jgi:hypothetical protein
MLSARDAVLTTRLSVCSGLGECTVGSFGGMCLRSATGSMEDRLALLPWLPLIAYEATLDLLLDWSGTSGVPGPDSADRPDVRDMGDGRMT